MRTLALGYQPAGVYRSRTRGAYWDGRNKVGEPVASGLYFYTLTAGNFTATRKMVITKCERAKSLTSYDLEAQKLYSSLPSGFLVANITQLNDSELRGHATFQWSEEDQGVRAVIRITNAAPGLHAAHLHTGTCDDIVPHWHPIEIPAGVSGVPVAEATRETPPVGIGEIGNIRVGEDGTGVLEFTTPFWTLDENPRSGILGKLILIHEAGDTFHSIPHLPDHTPIHADMHEMEAAHDEHPEVSGPGAKIGCGVLGILNEGQVSSTEPNP